MGLNNERAQRLVFDIETAPLPDAADYLESAEPPANYKDPVKIAAYLEEKRQDALARCSLDVDLCRVVAIGWQLEGDAVPLAMHEGHFADHDWVGAERLMLRSFWTLAQDHHLIGYNCLGFDLPVLLRRSLYLGVETPRIQIDRFKHPQVTDLMDELSYGGKLKLRGLSFYCRRFGIAVPDGLEGSQIGAAVLAGAWDQIETHVKADVTKTALLAERIGVFFPQPSPSGVL